jgi:hypothetical protein
MARFGDGVVVIAASTDRERAIKVRPNGSVMAGKAEAMVVGALDADDAVNGEETSLKLSQVFVANPLNVRIALVRRMNGSELRLQERNELVRGCFCLGELHALVA